MNEPSCVGEKRLNRWKERERERERDRASASEKDAKRECQEYRRKEEGRKERIIARHIARCI